METTDRMMIAGLALQGLLANPRIDPFAAEANVKQALLYAATLEGQTPDSAGEPRMVKIVRICSVAYNMAALAYTSSQDEHAPTTHSMWQEADEDAKERWYEACNAVLEGLPLVGRDNAFGLEHYVATDLGPAERSILRAVIAGWLDADG